MLKVTRTASNGRNVAGKDIVVIADGLITIRIDRVSGCQVHLSIEAPRDITILRGELHKSAFADEK